MCAYMCVCMCVFIPLIEFYIQYLNFLQFRFCNQSKLYHRISKKFRNLSVYRYLCGFSTKKLIGVIVIISFKIKYTQVMKLYKMFISVPDLTYQIFSLRQSFQNF